MPFPAARLATDELPGGPWIYGRQVEHAPDLEDGALVEVLDRSDRFVGHALYNGYSDIRLRMLSRGKKSDLAKPREFLLRKLSAAVKLRKKLLRLPEVTDAWRAVHAEGDDLPGLIVDRLGPVFVCEHHSIGFWKWRADVEWALKQLDPSASVVHRVPKGARKQEGFEPEEEPEGLEVEISEHGLRYPVLPGHGHKTGWFCDQRDNRQRVASFAAGLDVLDLCCNLGGFGLAAARAGAGRVTCVDLDEVALERAERAAELNGLQGIAFRHDDAFNTLRSTARETRRPGLVVLDPHKIIRGKANLEEGKRRYLDMNALALEAVAPGGLCATFSCSGALDLPSFLGLVFMASRRAGRDVKVLEIMGASPDHPQRPAFPRSRYLKGVLLAVD